MKKVLDKVMPDFFKEIPSNNKMDITSDIGIKEKKDDIPSFFEELSSQESDFRVDEPVEKKNEITEELEGGAYKDLPSKEGHEKHHIPADSTTDLSYGDGPCINMEKGDHRQTASWGNSIEAQEYRAKQKELIDNGKFEEAFQMDIDDIQDKFGDKYDKGIKEVKEYVQKLEEGGRI